MEEGGGGGALDQAQNITLLFKLKTLIMVKKIFFFAAIISSPT